jgi:urease accessory protein
LSTRQEPCDTVKLTFEARCKSRLLLRLESGETAALIVERGRLLRGGDRVRTEDGREIEIIAVEEALLEAVSDDPVALAKAAYHLGNRHVAVQVMPNRLRFLDDHVLGEMVKGLGLRVTAVLAAFEPEGGAYGHHHAHGSQMPLVRPKIHEFPPA